MRPGSESNQGWEIKSAASLSDQAYEILWKMISSGRIAPQERVSDTRLADLIGVSRTPVREAMSKLERDGVLVKLERGGYQVRSVRETDIRGMYNCRSVLEGLAAREAAEHMAEHDIAELRASMEHAEQLIAADDSAAVIRLNRGFHDAIVACCQNYYLQELVNSLYRLTNFNRHSLANMERKTEEGREAYRRHMKKNVADHLHILDAIEQRDGAEAENRMRVHLLYTGASMAKLFSDNLSEHD